MGCSVTTGGGGLYSNFAPFSSSLAGFSFSVLADCLTSKGAPTEMLATRIDKITYRAGSSIGIKALQRSRFCAGNKRGRHVKELLVSCPRNTRYFAGGQLAVFQGASEAPISESYGSSEQRGKTANWPRPKGLR